MIEIQDAVPRLGPLEQHRTGPVPEEHRRGAVERIDDGAHEVGPDDYDSLVRTGGHQLRPNRQRVEKAGAGGGQIEPPGTRESELVLDQTGGGREEHVGRDGGDDKRVDIVRVPARACAINRRTASAPIMEVVSPGAPIRRSRIPVRVTIHSSEVSSRLASSALVMTRSGT